MAWSPEISQLSTDLDQLTDAVNVKKNLLNVAVISTQNSKIATNTSAGIAANSAILSNASTQIANTHKNSTLSVYGTQAAQQTSLNIAAGQAGIASTSAVTATAGLTQDLSGINTAALHRSPYTITSMFVYDTSKDSDGGAWTEKCQHTSWYNETISGKWLGPQPNENSARVSNATLGPELFPNGSFTDINNLVFTPSSNCTLSIVNGRLRVTRIATGFGGAAVTLTGLTIGKLYRVQLDSFNGSLTAIHRVRKDTFSASYYGDNQYVGNTFISQETTLLFELGPVENSASGFCEYDNISVREVISSNTQSGDYFQLTTDGKFYRLWKNLLSQSNTFTNAAWLTFSGGVTVSANTTETLDPFGSNTATKFSYITGSGAIRNQVAIPINGVTSVYIKGGQGNRFSVTTGPNFGDSVIINPIDGSVVTLGTNQTSAIMTPVGNGWYRLTIIKNTTGNFLYLGYANVAGTAGDYAYVCAAQVENGTVATAYEAKVAEGSTSEVFRGNKRDFPRLAGIVCQSTGSNSSQVAIYDLTEPGRPMWMAFVDYSLKSAVTKLLDWNGDDTGWSHVAMMNGWLVGTSNTSAGMCHFIKDWIAGVNGVEFSKNRVSDRNDVGAVTSTGRLTFAAAQFNSARTVRMLVEPNAPVEPDTGLQRPSVLIGSTQPTYNSPTGVSFFYHTTANYDDVVFFPKLIAARRGFNSFSPNFFYTINPGLSSAVSGEITATSAPDFALGGNTTKLIGAANGEFLRAPAASLVQKLKLNTSAVAKSLTATIRDTFNTGWMPGDIRRAYLSDTDVGSSGPATQIVTNSEFTDGVAGWTVTNPNSVSITVNAGVVSFDQIATPLATMYQAITVIPGRQYTINARTGSVGGNYFHTISVGNTTTSTEYYTRRTALGMTIHGGDFTPTQSTIYVSMLTGSGLNDLAYLDYIRVYETTIKDRSYKAIECNTNGTITKSQLAAGTSLVGYSGFSTSNYIQEPYSADLDFGTGEFSASAWVNIPNSAITAQYQTYGPDLLNGAGAFTDPTGWTGLTANCTISGGILTKTGGATHYVSLPVTGLVGGDVVMIQVDCLSVSGGVGMYIGHAANWNSAEGITTTGTQYRVVVKIDTIYPSGIGFSFGGGVVGSFANLTMKRVRPSPIFSRSFSSGPAVDLYSLGPYHIQARVWDGTTQRKVTYPSLVGDASVSQFPRNIWQKAEVNYTTDGSLAIRVNGREVAVTRGNPLLTLNSRRNLLTWTEQFDNALWLRPAGTTTISPNTATAPDGTMTADLVTATAGNNCHYVYQANLGTASVTFSVYAKAGTANWIGIGSGYTNGGETAWFNLATGTPGTVSSGGTSTMVDALNGWWRCSITRPTWVAGGAIVFITNADAAPTFNAVGTETVLLWGAQGEIGTAPTTYQRVAVTPETNVAPLTIGNSYAADAPFPGSITLLKLGATAPTPEQSIFMYEQEKQLFRPGAVSILPDANAIIDMSYDDATDRWAAVSTTNESYWNGLVRSSVTPVPAGSYSKITTTSGVELVSRTTSNTGVDISIPPYALREELVKRSETASKLTRKTVTYDYTGGFTGNITIGSTSILSIAGLTYPTSYIGARISGTGIPANTVITGVSGTTLYISAPATATTTTLTITFLDFILPAGMEAKNVLSAGVIRREGSTFDYTRLFDGFIETIRFAVAPGSTAWVQIQATRTIQ